MLLSYRAGSAAAMAKTDPAAALLELVTIVDVGCRAAEVLQAGDYEHAAEVISDTHKRDVH